jgi:APA family basic amino acid/polyamine antiporter
MPHPRKLGPWTATALVVGNIIGAGIFMLPRELAPYGWTAVLGWILTVAGALCLAWMFAQLFTHLPTAGGVHGFMRLGVGPQAAFVGSWGYLVSVFAANATLAISGVEYLSRLVPGGLALDHRLALALLSLVAVLSANLLGRGGEVQLGTTIIKLVPLVLVIGVGTFLLATTAGDPFASTAPASLQPLTVLPAMSLTLYAMTGIESAVVPADAVEDAPRIVPRATMVGTALSGAIGILATCLVILLLPNAAGSDAPLADFVARSAGGRAGDLVALCAVVSCIGCLNGYVLVGGELMATMATQGMLPASLARRNGWGAPAIPQLIGAAITAVLIVAAYTATSAFAFAALITAATNITLYLLCLLASLRFLRDGRLPRSHSLLIAITGATVFSLLALVGAGAEALGWGAALIALGWPLYRLATRAGSA